MSGERLRLSACIVCMNEADNIARCIESVSFCDEVVVVDSHSTDDTRRIAEDLGARVFERDWPGFGPQKEFAVAQARHDWVLCLDADEWLSSELREAIEALGAEQPGDLAGYRMARLSWYFGEWVDYGGWYPDRQLRLYHRERGSWGGKAPHEKVQTEQATRLLPGDLLHRPYRSLSDHLRKIDGYTTVMARDLHAKGKRSGLAGLLLRPLFHFLKFYLLKGGILHGVNGLLLSPLAAHYVFAKYAKLWLLQRDGEAALPPLDRRA